MLDPKAMYPDMYHPRHRTERRDYKGTAKFYSRTERPTKYYYVDFGLSRKYDPADGPPLELPILGGDKTVPEFQGEGYNIAVDPFPTDIYYLGNLIRMAFLQVGIDILVLKDANQWAMVYVNSTILIFTSSTRSSPTWSRAIHRNAHPSRRLLPGSLKLHPSCPRGVSAVVLDRGMNRPSSDFSWALDTCSGPRNTS